MGIRAGNLSVFHAGYLRPDGPRPSLGVGSGLLGRDGMRRWKPKGSYLFHDSFGLRV
jgi:hypothetical protein